ncbi:MAG: pre-peptidase C-terminal domain-containing protein [Planctomycetes bacterium]|nr:pre-peptidase C-terminal domain-containing protein [Planctomycetota bacterium]
MTSTTPVALLLSAFAVLTAMAPAQGVPEAAEPNSSLATATVLAGGQQAFGAISAGDEDWFALTLTADRDYRIWTGPGSAVEIHDTRVRILAADGMTVLADVDDGSPITHGDYTLLTGKLVAGTYYVAVRGHDAGTTGSYTLDVVLADRGVYERRSVAEATESNDPRQAYGSGTPTVSGHDTRNVGTITTAGGGASYTVPAVDYDFYELAVTAPGTFVMETVVGAAAPALTDSVIFLADAALQEIAFDDDGGAGLLSRLTAALTPGTYYVVVKGFSSATTGNYELAITGPKYVATVAAPAGGCAGSNGTPRLGVRHGASFGETPERPVLGSTFVLDGTNLPTNTGLFRVIGLLSLAAPYDLGPFGAPGCAVEVAPIDQSIALVDGSGVHFWPLALPANCAYIGMPLEQQLVVYDPGANPLGVTASNRVSSVLGTVH